MDFQANPKKFDIDSYLSTRPSTALWSLTRLKNEIKVGDQVFIWRAIGDDDADKSGVVARA
ncbi:MAG: hypothetical protein JWQ49_4455 [Edaphobacter sp.]|nr:hypothetical protein [Edaphobacter sp.]